jgi:hypothetical protein
MTPNQSGRRDEVQGDRRSASGTGCKVHENFPADDEFPADRAGMQGNNLERATGDSKRELDAGEIDTVIPVLRE